MIKETILGWLLMTLAFSVWADAVEISGNSIQGGVIFGHAEPGTRLTLDGRPLTVSAQGQFVIGFDRDAAAVIPLEIDYPAGRHESRMLRVDQRRYDIQRIEGLPSDKVAPPAEVLERIRMERAQVTEVRARDTEAAYFMSGFRWPVTGRISGVFGSQRILNDQPRQPHNGVDIAAPEGTPVYAPADGVVSLANPDMYLSGGTLILDHGLGLSSSFLHLQKIFVQAGQLVGKGDLLATVGATGRVTGPHLHWGMNWFEQRVDPALLVPPMGQ